MGDERLLNKGTSSCQNGKILMKVDDGQLVEGLYLYITNEIRSNVQIIFFTYLRNDSTQIKTSNLRIGKLEKTMVLLHFFCDPV